MYIAHTCSSAPPGWSASRWSPGSEPPTFDGRTRADARGDALLYRGYVHRYIDA